MKVKRQSIGRVCFMVYFLYHILLISIMIQAYSYQEHIIISQVKYSYFLILPAARYAHIFIDAAQSATI